MGACRLSEEIMLKKKLDRPLHPDLVVMKRRATDRGDGFGAGEHVDATAADMVAVSMDRFGDQHAAAHALEQFRDQPLR